MSSCGHALPALGSSSKSDQILVKSFLRVGLSRYFASYISPIAFHGCYYRPCCANALSRTTLPSLHMRRRPTTSSDTSRRRVNNPSSFSPSVLFLLTYYHSVPQQPLAFLSFPLRTNAVTLQHKHSAFRQIARRSRDYSWFTFGEGSLSVWYRVAVTTPNTLRFSGSSAHDCAPDSNSPLPTSPIAVRLMTTPPWLNPCLCLLAHASPPILVWNSPPLFASLGLEPPLLNSVALALVPEFFPPPFFCSLPQPPRSSLVAFHSRPHVSRRLPRALPSLAVLPFSQARRLAYGRPSPAPKLLP